MTDRFCQSCRRVLPLSEFGIDRKTWDGRTRYCRDCYAKNNARRNRLIAEKYDLWVTTWKLEQGCARCGYREHPAALHIDHIEPGAWGSKFGGFKSMRHWFQVKGVTLTMADVQAELTKCQVLCANCHAVKSAEDREVYGVEWNARRRNGAVRVREEREPDPSLFEM